MHSFLRLSLCAAALQATLALAAEPQADTSAGAQQITRARATNPRPPAPQNSSPVECGSIPCGLRTEASTPLVFW